MEITKILSACDHTLLAQAATWEDIKAICDDGIKYGTATYREILAVRRIVNQNISQTNVQVW